MDIVAVQRMEDGVHGVGDRVVDGAHGVGDRVVVRVLFGEGGGGGMLVYVVWHRC